MILNLECRDKGLYDWFKGKYSLLSFVYKHFILGYSEIKHIIHKYAVTESSVLNVGCGNS